MYQLEYLINGKWIVVTDSIDSERIFDMSKSALKAGFLTRITKIK